jgi:hypothetical protein
MFPGPDDLFPAPTLTEFGDRESRAAAGMLATASGFA